MTLGLFAVGLSRASTLAMISFPLSALSPATLSKAPAESVIPPFDGSLVVVISFGDKLKVVRRFGGLAGVDTSAACP